MNFVVNLGWSVIFSIHSFAFSFFIKIFVGPRSILWCYWYPLIWTVDSAHGFQSQGGSIVACTLLLLACFPDPCFKVNILATWTALIAVCVC